MPENEMKMDGAISDFFREHYNPNWTKGEQIDFLFELFANLSLHVRPVFKSDYQMIKFAKEIMEEALKRRKVEFYIRPVMDEEPDLE